MEKKIEEHIEYKVEAGPDFCIPIWYMGFITWSDGEQIVGCKSDRFKEKTDAWRWIAERLMKEDYKLTMPKNTPNIIESKVQEILNFIKSDYPKASSQKEHDHNIEIVEYAVNQCKYGLKEKLRQAIQSHAEAVRRDERREIKKIVGRHKETCHAGNHQRGCLSYVLANNKNQVIDDILQSLSQEEE